MSKCKTVELTQLTVQYVFIVAYEQAARIMFCTV